MTKAQLLAAFLAGSAAGGMTTAALIRESPRTATYFSHRFSATAAPLEDGGMAITSAEACVTATLDLVDGGVDRADIGCHPCPVSAGDADLRALKRVMTASAACGRNAP